VSFHAAAVTQFAIGHLVEGGSVCFLEARVRVCITGFFPGILLCARVLSKEAAEVTRPIFDADGEGSCNQAFVTLATVPGSQLNATA
jgi:hypothetical protein